MRPPGFPLLALPHPALVNIFSALAELADSVALSSCNKELWALGAAARRRYLCCAACGARAVEPSAAFNTDTFRHAPPLALADGASYAVDKEHVEAGCTLGEDLPLLSYTTLNSLRVCIKPQCRALELPSTGFCPTPACVRRQTR